MLVVDGLSFPGVDRRGHLRKVGMGCISIGGLEDGLAEALIGDVVPEKIVEFLDLSLETGNPLHLGLVLGP